MEEKSYRDQLFDAYKKAPKCVPLKEVGVWFDKLLTLLYPYSNKVFFDNRKAFELYIDQLELDLEKILFCDFKGSSEQARKVCESLFGHLNDIKYALDTDIQAIYDGDPAASSHEEVIRCYPGFYAIAAHRVAHHLYELQVPIVPRMIAECAHNVTGIDIHPGAQIGHHFCIDHGTGIVIGQTCIIGNHVKIYQGVTLGGLSVNKQDANKKRHPTIEDQVVIYAGATILGGQTTVGKKSIIGGNTFITKSVAPNSKVYYSNRN